MEIYSDKRSQKFYELDMNKNVKICWLFTKAKCQFRFRGKSRNYKGKHNLRHWDKLSQESKSIFSWPFPGDHFVFNESDDLFSKVNNDISNNFALLKIEINHVDQLLLKKPIHKRIRWIRYNVLIEERLNPLITYTN